MKAGGNFFTAEGMGGRAFSVMDVVVSFIAAFFHRILTTIVPPSKSKPNPKSDFKPKPKPKPEERQQQQDDNPDSNNNQQHQHELRHDHPDTGGATTATTHENGESTLAADADADLQRMPPPLQKQPTAANQPNGLREVNANGLPVANVALPRLATPNGAPKQENAPATGAAAQTANGCDTANTTNGVKFRSVGEEQAEENRQEYITLPPPVTEQDGDEPEDPAKAAERAIHHGFMNQALDVVRLLVSCRLDFFTIFYAYGKPQWCLFSSLSRPLYIVLCIFIVTFPSCRTRLPCFKSVHLITPPSSCPAPSLAQYSVLLFPFEHFQGGLASAASWVCP